MALAQAAVQLAAAARSYWRLPAAVNPTTWTEALGIRLVLRQTAEEGRYLRYPTPTIHLRPYPSEERSRFTFAHEVGHHVLEESRRNVGLRSALRRETLWILSEIPPASEEEEDLCDRLAAEFLLSRRDATTWIQSERATVDGIVMLAAQRGMSLTATMRQLRSAEFNKALVIMDTRSAPVTVTAAVGCPLPRGTRLVRGTPHVSDVPHRLGWMTTHGKLVQTLGTVARPKFGEAMVLLANNWGWGMRVNSSSTSASTEAVPEEADELQR